MRALIFGIKNNVLVFDGESSGISKRLIYYIGKNAPESTHIFGPTEEYLEGVGIDQDIWNLTVVKYYGKILQLDSGFNHDGMYTVYYTKNDGTFPSRFFNETNQYKTLDYPKRCLLLASDFSKEPTSQNTVLGCC